MLSGGSFSGGLAAITRPVYRGYIVDADINLEGNYV